MNPRQKFANWAGNQACFPENYFQPANEAELKALIQRAGTENKKIRVTGASHSWSANFLTNDFLVNIDALNRTIDINPETGRVTVGAGLRLKDLNEYLAENGLAMTNLGSISQQSIAGATSTGTHGSGIRYGSLSTRIEALKLALADGSTLTVSPEENAEWLPAARLSLGALGVVTEVTLQTVPAFNLKEHSFPLTFAQMLADFQTVHQNVDHYKYWWMPHANVVQTSHYTRTPEPRRPYSRAQAFMYHSVLQDKFFLGLLALGNVFPTLRPAINGLAAQTGFTPRKRIDRSDRVFNIPMPVRHLEYEYAIPAECAADALTRMEEEIRRRRIFVNFVVEIRFVKADDLWLSPAYGRDSCYIGAFMRGEKFWPEYAEMFTQIMDSYGGRPHWGKDFAVSHENLRSLYPKFEDFLALRNRLDPNRRFANEWLDRVLGK